MNIRPLTSYDLADLREIHAKFYADEFSFADFTSGFISSCVIEDDMGRIITAGGIRPLIEVVALTNKNLSVRTRKEALYAFLQATMFMAHGQGIHVFIQDTVWENHLRRFGFRDTKGKSLIFVGD